MSIKESGSTAWGPSGRSFGILDMMAAVCALAILFAVGRLFLWFYGGSLFPYFEVERVNQLTTLALFGPSLALLPIVIVRGEDRLRLRSGSPGLFVPLVVWVVTGLQVVRWGMEQITIIRMLET